MRSIILTIILIPIVLIGLFLLPFVLVIMGIFVIVFLFMANKARKTSNGRGFYYSSFQGDSKTARSNTHNDAIDVEYKNISEKKSSDDIR